MATLTAVPDELMSPNPRCATVAMELSAVRAQAALVRSLLDELDQLVPPSGSARFAEAFAAQAMEELAHLGQRMMELAVAVAPHRVTDLGPAVGLKSL